MKRIVIALMLATPLAGCATFGGSSTAPLADRVAITATNGLSLAELAYNSTEETATALLKSGHLSKSDVARLGALIHQARSYRDQARSLVASGGDANAVLANLAQALTNIKAIKGN